MSDLTDTDVKINEEGVTETQEAGEQLPTTVDTKEDDWVAIDPKDATPEDSAATESIHVDVVPEVNAAPNVPGMDETEKRDGPEETQGKDGSTMGVQEKEAGGATKKEGGDIEKQVEDKLKELEESKRAEEKQSEEERREEEERQREDERKREEEMKREEEKREEEKKREEDRKKAEEEEKLKEEERKRAEEEERKRAEEEERKRAEEEERKRAEEERKRAEEEERKRAEEEERKRAEEEERKRAEEEERKRAEEEERLREEERKRAEEEERKRAEEEERKRAEEEERKRAEEEERKRAEEEERKRAEEEERKRAEEEERLREEERKRAEKEIRLREEEMKRAEEEERLREEERKRAEKEVRLREEEMKRAEEEERKRAEEEERLRQEERKRVEAEKQREEERHRAERKQDEERQREEASKTTDMQTEPESIDEKDVAPIKESEVIPVTAEPELTRRKVASKDIPSDHFPTEKYGSEGPAPSSGGSFVKGSVFALIVISFVIFGLFKYTKAPPTDIDPDPAPADCHLRKRSEREGVLFEEMESFSKRFPTLDQSSLDTMAGASLAHVQEGQELIRPVVLLLVGQPGHVKANKVANQLAHVYDKVYYATRGDIVRVDGVDFKDDSADDVKRDIDSRLKRGLQGCARVVVINDFDEIPSCSAILFHGYCDNDGAPYKDAVFILTMTLREAIPKETSKLDTEKMIQDYLGEIWQQCPEEFPKGKIVAMNSRVANNIVMLS